MPIYNFTGNQFWSNGYAGKFLQHINFLDFRAIEFAVGFNEFKNGSWKKWGFNIGRVSYFGAGSNWRFLQDAEMSVGSWSHSPSSPATDYWNGGSFSGSELFFNATISLTGVNYQYGPDATLTEGVGSFSFNKFPSYDSAYGAFGLVGQGVVVYIETIGTPPEKNGYFSLMDWPVDNTFDLCKPPQPGGPNCEATDHKWVTEDEVKQVLGSGYYRTGEYASLFLCSGGSFTINPAPVDACDIAGSKCVILHAADGTKYLSRCSDILDKNPRPQDSRPPPEFCFLCWLNGCCNEHSKRLSLPKVSVGTVRTATTTMVEVFSAIGKINIPNFQPIAWPTGTRVVIWNPTKKNTFPKVLGKTAA